MLSLAPTGLLLIALGESLAIVGAVMIVAIIGYAASLYVRRYGSHGRLRTDRCHDVLSQWAASRRLRFDGELLRIEGVVDDLDILVSATYDQIEWSLPPALMMSTIARHPQPIVVQVGRSWFALDEQIARNRVQLGDPVFDAHFKTWCDQPAIVDTILSASLRERLLALDPDELLYDRGVIELRWDDDFADGSEDSYRRLDDAFSIVLALSHRDRAPAH
ncbi:MAG TPA: hypothetical protein VNA88_10440 [Candidatus Kapabacteria bacterium]|jgi:hypothetical protein|nr:hypothetical protein [Candidatus Kapabacteria bacterium]